MDQRPLYFDASRAAEGASVAPGAAHGVDCPACYALVRPEALRRHMEAAHPSESEG
jgi:hypothetical protein